MVECRGAMIRVGFVLEQDGSWLGGVNYYRNLLQAIFQLPGRQIEPLLVVGKNSRLPEQLDMAGCRVVRSSILDRRSLPWWIRKLLTKLLKRDVLLQRLLQQQNVQLLSHSGSLGRNSRIPCLCWMADFQHKHLPQFFEQEEILVRDSLVARWQEECAGILFSSEDARKDMQRWYPHCSAKLELLPFVAGVEHAVRPMEFQKIKDRLGLPEQFFLVANQFWAHKNHRVIIEALQLLKQQGRRVCVVATGNTGDYRKSGFFGQLMEQVREAGVESEFRVTGVLPYAELTLLMQNTVAMINPSLFEGWNTSVEEAKSLGKQVILSDIPVHREQAPQRGHYFAPHDAKQLATVMWHLQSAYDAEADHAAMQQAERAFSGRQLAFAGRYQDIVLRTINIQYKQ